MSIRTCGAYLACVMLAACGGDDTSTPPIDAPLPDAPGAIDAVVSVDAPVALDAAAGQGWIRGAGITGAANQVVLKDLLETHFVRDDAARWLEKFAQAGVPGAPINAYSDALADALVFTRDYFAPRF